MNMRNLLFLTNAQEEIVIDMYNGKNPFGDSFERTEEIRRYLSTLIKTYTTTDKKVGYTGGYPNPQYSLNYLMTYGS